MHSLREVRSAALLLEWAEMEVRAVCDTESSAPEFQMAIQFHRSLGRIAKAENFQAPRPKRAGGAAQFAAQALIDRINDLAGVALRQARSAFVAATKSPVEYLFVAGEEEDDVVLLAAENVFNRFFDSITAVPLNVRNQPLQIQKLCIEVAGILCRERNLEMESALEPFSDVEQRLSVCRSVLEARSAKLPADTFGGVRDFEISCLEALAEDTCCVPRAIAADEPVAALREVARMYSAYGRTLRFPHLDELRGNERDVERVRLAWRRFESAGRAMQALGGWIRALAAEGGGRLCTICYRHAATKLRCTEHATKTHETRTARLGRRVRPIYLEKLHDLMSSDAIRRHLERRAHISHAQLVWFTKQARARGVTRADLIRRIVSLAAYLNALQGILSSDQSSDMWRLFSLLVECAVGFGELPAPRTGDEERRRKLMDDGLLELLSTQGYFRSWFRGHIPMFNSGNDQARRRYDDRHPIALESPLDLATLQMHLLMQRAWDEAEAEYRRSAMPDAATIAELRAEGLSYADIGGRVGLSHQSIRNNAARQNESRRRNRLI